MSNYYTKSIADSTFATIASLSSYVTNSSLTSTLNNYLLTVTANSTFQTIAGMSLYLTSSLASSTY